MPTFLLLALTAAALVVVGTPWRAALRRLGLPPAVSLLVLGAAVGPAAWDVLPPAWLGARTALSAAAFVVLLLRAGLGISPAVLRRIAPAALLLGTVPVVVEAGVFTTLARALRFGSWPMSALAGFLVAAVSPAVILPAMLARKEAGRGGPRHVPDLIMGQTLVNSMLAPVVILGLLGAITSTAPDRIHPVGRGPVRPARRRGPGLRDRRTAACGPHPVRGESFPATRRPRGCAPDRRRSRAPLRMCAHAVDRGCRGHVGAGRLHAAAPRRGAARPA